MRILHVSDCYLPRLGGIEVQVADLIRNQREAGHEVEVATATPGERLPGVRRLVARMPFDLPVHPRGTGHLIRLMTSYRPDVVHVHTGAVSPFAWMGVRAAHRAGLPAVVTVHSMWDPVTKNVYRALRALSEWHRWGLVATAVSEAAARPIRQVAGPRVPVRVVSNGLDLTGWGPAGPMPSGDPVHVVAVGRLAPRKQPVRLLKLLAAARARVPAEVAMRATIVGDGPARASMERYLRAHRMDWVRMPGRYTREQIRELLAGADVFVAPAPRESFGLAALEARAAGVPVVARAQSGVADFVRPGKEGLLGGSFDELVGSVARLARDARLRTSIAEHNRETAPVRCSWPAVLEGFDRCYALARGGEDDS
ncbi:GDP-mannose-dependent alpha-(1-6)-phosphatidylinositol dimannoside mannosyltransferase [Acrocarpospora phusangensis]|uniref:GDP-mannose-dependent alpha-(1-6)-phosphatidylinositol dimannoside mannosyltransferase n=1 Tax=Acrocarpospora phusangensis TaxID=1070424 RepID=A0A919QL37_9ACTN|nr:GDP-mannose-dependent alpha-(1-6)-phosphatidylinositol dimannoside mannosyltransferase [Acrocarpospora phusangensis]